MPDSETLGLVLDVENDRLRVCFKHQKLGRVTTRRELLVHWRARVTPWVSWNLVCKKEN